MQPARFAQLLSLLDNDFYKFTMQQCVAKLFPRARARYAFINRGRHTFPEDFANRLQASVDAMAGLQLSVAEKAFLEKACPYLDPVYLDLLQGYRYDASEVTIVQEGGNISVTVEGLWYRTILWEVPLLCLISENYYVANEGVREDDDAVQKKASEKLARYKKLGVTIADFGTRRRHSFAVQSKVVETLMQDSATFVGSSNVHLAMRYGTKPIGTHAHEWFMFHAARYGFKMANTMALENWVQVYRGDLGIALSDTFTTAEFFEIFDKKFAKLFDGVRHDSGDPVAFAEKTIAHYRHLQVDPRTKTIIFSDSLDYEKVAHIVQACRDRIGMSFGIGTNLTNDVGLQPLSIVMKMTEARPEGEGWIPVVKLSDERGKYTGVPEYIQLAKAVLQIKE